MSEISCVNYRPGRRVPVAGILAPLRRGTGDPTFASDSRIVAWATMLPSGPATVLLVPRADGADAYLAGPGAGELALRVPQLLGDDDDVSTFRPTLPQLQRAMRQPEHANWRVMKSGLVMVSLIPSVIEQKVTGKQAFAAYRTLIRGYGRPASAAAALAQRAASLGASPRLCESISRLTAPPTTSEWKRIPSWQWLKAGVEPPQSRTLMRALDVADQLETTAKLPIGEAHRRLRSVPGIGIWTAAKVAQTAWGDADAPTFADYHVAHQIGHALYGHDIDDARMAAALEGFRPHRYRAERLILAVGPRRERRGERMALPTHLPKM